METAHQQHHEGPHPTERLYVKVALWLAVVTAIEIGVSYIEMPRWLAIVSLVVLAVVKFVAVVAYFMHLKFDARLLRRPFVGGLFLAMIIYFIVSAMFLWHSRTID